MKATTATLIAVIGLLVIVVVLLFEDSRRSADLQADVNSSLHLLSRFNADMIARSGIPPDVYDAEVRKLQAKYPYNRTLVRYCQLIFEDQATRASAVE